MTPKFAILIFAAALPLLGQAPNGQQLRARLAEVRETLNLTPEQTEKVIPVLVEEFRALIAVRDGSDRPRQKLREAGEIQSKTDGQLKEILDEKQQKDLAGIREQWRKERRKGRSPQ